MPSRDQHLDQAARDEAFALHLFEVAWSTDCNDWMLVALFYAAVHLVDAYLASLDFHPETHGVRDGYVSHLTSLRPIFAHYRELRRRSETARYECLPFALSRQRVESLRVREYEAIKRHIEGLLGTSDTSSG